MNELISFDKVLEKKEKNYITPEDFIEKYPHFFEQIGKVTHKE